MQLKHNQFSNFYFPLHFLFVVLLNTFIKLSSCNEGGISRSLDLSWRPLSLSPYQQYMQNSNPGALISYAHFDASNKDEIVEAAKHNAQLLRQYKDAHQPITSYSDPYVYSHTPAPMTKFLATTTLFNPNIVRSQQQIAAASSNILSRVPFPGKATSLYQTKLNYLGKPDSSSNQIYHHNSIHQTLGTTPKIAGYTQEHGRLNFHYHHPSLGISSMPTTTKRNPIFR